MKIFILLGLTFITSFCLTRLLCSAPPWLSSLDHPNERSLHSTPTLRTGGIAILGGLLLGVLAYFLLHSFWGWAIKDFIPIYQILGLTFLMGILSFWDDQKHLHPGLRFGFQLVLAALFLTITSYRINSISIPVIGSFPFGWFEIPLTLLFIVWITNLYNFMDGMDGFAGGMTLFGCIFFGLIAWQHHELAITITLFLTASASGGFLMWNFPPARIFMGDVGSTSLGFLIGCLIVMSLSKNPQMNLWGPLLIFSPFLVDSILTLLKRLLKGEKIWGSHREHYYQKLVLSGWGHKKTVLVEYGLMTICGLSALLYVKLNVHKQLGLLLVWFIIYALLSLAIQFLRKSGTRNL